MPFKNALILVGPTTCGKTDIAIEVARKTKGELINAWYTPLYKGFPIITVHIDLEKDLDIPTHLYGVLDPIERPFPPREYLKRVENITKEILERGGLPIIEGGNRRYFKKLYYNNNKKKYSTIIGITWDDFSQYELRVQQRVDDFFKRGLIKEVKHALKKGYRESFILLENGVTYPVVKYVDGEITLKEAKKEIIDWFLRCANFSMEKFKEYRGIKWFNYNPKNKKKTVNTILSMINK